MSVPESRWAAQSSAAELHALPPSGLLAQAEAAGLTVRAEGGRLIVRGDRAAEGLARVLLRRKADLLPVLTAATRRATGHRLTSHARQADDNRPVYVVVPGGHVLKVGSVHAIPPRASWWCREGDAFWQPIVKPAAGEGV